MGYSAVYLKGHTKVSTGSGHPGQMAPVCMQKSDCPEADPVCRQNTESHVPV